MFWLRSSAARLLALPGAVASTVVLFADAGWQGGWGDTVLRATTAALVLLSFVAVAGALDGWRVLSPSAHPSASTGARPPVVVAARVTTACAAWGLVAYLVVLGPGLAATARVNPLLPPPIPWGWIAAGATAVVAHAAIGVLLGAVLPRLLAAGLAGLLGFVGNALLSAYQERVPGLFTVVDAAFLGGAAQPRTVVQLLQAGFFLAAAAAAVAVAGLHAGRHTRRRAGGGSRAGTAAAAALPLVPVIVPAIVLAVVLAGTGGPKRDFVVDTAGPVACDERRIVCLWADRAHLTDAFGGLGGRMLAGLPAGVCVRGWAEIGLHRAECVAEVYVSNNRPSADAIAQALAEGLVDLVAPNLEPGADQRRLLVGWLESRALGDPVRIGEELQPRLNALLAAPIDTQWNSVLAVLQHAA